MAAGTECAAFVGSLDKPTTATVSKSSRMRRVNALVSSTNISCPVCPPVHIEVRQTSAVGEDSALAALAAAGMPYRVIRHGPVRSLAEAAEARGVVPADVVKTLVVRRADDDYLFVLVPGDRTISWPK